MNRSIQKIACLLALLFLTSKAKADQMPPQRTNVDSLKIAELLDSIRNSWQDVPKALSLCSEAATIADRSNNKRLQLLTYFNIGVDHLEFYKNYNQTLSYLLKALGLAKEIKDSLLIQRCYQSIGNTYSDLFEVSSSNDDFKDAVLNLNMALEINKALIKKKGVLTVFMGNNYTNLSDLYLKKQDDSLSLLYAQKALDIYSKNKDRGGTDLAEGNICKALLLKARKTHNKNDYLICKENFIRYFNTYELAKRDNKARFDSLPAGSKFWASLNLYNHYISLAEISLALNEGEKVFNSCIEKAEYYARESKNINNLINTLKFRSAYYEKSQPAMSLKLKNEILALQDSAFTIEARKKNETLKAIFLFNRKEIEYNQVEAENKLKSAQLEAEQRNLKVKNTLLIISVISIVLFIVFSIYLFSLNKKLNAKNILVSEQREMILIKNRQITDSINFSKVIQDEILFSKNNLNEHFSEHFLMYLPKDIVSGDFYYVKRSGDTLAVAVVDCTGHGTSGAMMTLHANSILDHLFEDLKSKDASFYMNELNNRVKSGFFATNDFEYGSKFGMDISLLILHKKTAQASFCSTNHPLLVKTHHELMEYKPKKSTLAYSTEEYTSFNFEITSGTLFYLFTDGFYDQKGGTSAKKFLFKNFKELLSLNAHLSMEEQLQVLNETHTQWRGPYRQTDDITVLGFKL